MTICLNQWVSKNQDLTKHRLSPPRRYRSKTRLHLKTIQFSSDRHPKNILENLHSRFKCSIHNLELDLDNNRSKIIPKLMKDNLNHSRIRLTLRLRIGLDSHLRYQLSLQEVVVGTIESTWTRQLQMHHSRLLIGSYRRLERDLVNRCQVIIAYLSNENLISDIISTGLCIMHLTQ